jgi:hypothetical protein
MPVDECLYPALRHDLRLLTQVARAARKRREQAGAVELSAGGELKFKLVRGADGVPKPVAVKAKEELEVS